MVEVVPRDVRAEFRVRKRQSAERLIGVKAGVVRIGQIRRRAAEDALRAGGNVLWIAGRYWLANVLVILFLGDIDQPSEPHFQIATLERTVKIAVNVGRQREHEARVAARLGKRNIIRRIGRRSPVVDGAEIGKAVVVDDEIGVDFDAGRVGRRDVRLERRFGAVERFVARRAEIEAVEQVVADREIAGIGPLRRRQPHLPVANLKNIRHAVLDRVPTRFKHLQDGRCRDILGRGGRWHRRRREGGKRCPGRDRAALPCFPPTCHYALCSVPHPPTIAGALASGPLR